ncbi:recombinase family protein [Tardiphaga sp. 20_F10_N6_6]|uniref:recombinase family protein n=1 Tax=Tardiphaga sp. 20_F10_N6_6 TaxID=3240788 RepID=UPI003F8A3B25
MRKAVTFISINRASTPAPPAGRAMFQMMGVFAEFERAIIRERVVAGLARAKAEGKAVGRPTVGAEVENAIRQMRRDRLGIQKIARTLGVGVSVVQRVVATSAV